MGRTHGFGCAQLSTDIDPTKPLLALLISAGTSLLPVTAATVPLIRTRLTPKLLRSE